MGAQERTAEGPTACRRQTTPLTTCILFNAALLSSSVAYALILGDYEFALYGVAFLALLPLLWVWLRPFNLPALPLVLITGGVLLHFASGFLRIGPTVLYGQQFLGLYVDKYVHLYNGMATAVLIAFIMSGAGLRLHPMEGFVVIVMALGLAAIVEILEFLAVVTVHTTGVGDYFNNIGDLVADLLGAFVGYGVYVAAKSARAIAQPREI